MKKKSRVGSSFDDFLKEEGTYEEVTARAIKRVIARQPDALMEEEGLTKTELAKRMKTSRAQLDRLFDPDNEFRDARRAHARGTSRRAAATDGACVTLSANSMGPIQRGPRRGPVSGTVSRRAPKSDSNLKR